MSCELRLECDQAMARPIAGGVLERSLYYMYIIIVNLFLIALCGGPLPAGLDDYGAHGSLRPYIVFGIFNKTQNFTSTLVV